jgi:type II secretory pathway component PulL
MTDILLSIFPETKTILDPYQQMQRSMENLMARGGTRPNDMLVMLSRVGSVTQSDPRVRLRGIQYSDRSLTLDITLPDQPTLERIRQSLQSGGLQADLLSSTAHGSDIEGRLRVRARNDASGTRS